MECWAINHGLLPCLLNGNLVLTQTKCHCKNPVSIFRPAVSVLVVGEQEGDSRNLIANYSGFLQLVTKAPSQPIRWQNCLTIDSVIDTTKQSCLPETVKYMYTQVDIGFVYIMHRLIAPCQPSGQKKWTMKTRLKGIIKKVTNYFALSTN